MPGSDPKAGRRGGLLLAVLFWTGVGLTPFAAALLLLGGDRPLRVAVVLTVGSVVAIGLSLTLRRDGAGVRAQVEDLLYEEIDSLREEVREDITAAVRATHRSLSEKMMALHEMVEALRAQVDGLRAQLERGAAQPSMGGGAPVGVAHVPVSGHVGPGVVRHTETVQVTTRQTIVDPNESMGGRGTVYGSRSASTPAARIPAQRGADRADSTDEIEGRDDGRSRRAGGRDAGRWEEPARRGAGRRVDEPDRWGEPAGRDEPRRGDEPDRRDDARRRAGAEWWGDSGRWDEIGRGERGRGDDLGPRDEPGRRGEPAGEEESWTEQMLRRRLGAALDGGGRRRADESADEEDRITGVRATDRWASLRSDEYGRELRVGERRAAMRADESGTELRIEDRWAAVRREDGRRTGSRHGRDDLDRDDLVRDPGDLGRDLLGRDDPGRDPLGRSGSGRDGSRRDGGRDDLGVDLGGTDPDRFGVGRDLTSRDSTGRRGTRDSFADSDDDRGDWRRDLDRERDRDWDRGRDRRGDDGLRWSETRWEESRAGEPDRWSEIGRRGGPAALPAAPSEPASSWLDWRSGSTEAEPVGRRSRHGDQDEDLPRWRGPADDWRGSADDWRASADDEPRGRGRRGHALDDLELSDDRWR